MTRASLVGAICLAGSLLGQATYAQSGLMELYGEGVHRYFAGDHFGAEELFNRALAGGSQDPRLYYFRGLIQEGRGGGGEADFEQGARLEVSGRISVPVGQSLTRVQGHVRGKIERARRDARVAYAQQQAAMMGSEAMEAADAGATKPSLPTPTDPATPPFADGLRSDATTTDAAPSTAEVDAGNDPFKDDPATTTPANGAAGDSSTDTPSAGDIFGGSEPAPNAGGTEPQPGNPFGEPDASPGNPFGDPDASAPGNPFGDS